MSKFTKEELELLHKALRADIPDPTPYMAAQSLLNGDCEDEDAAWFYVRDYACYY